MLELEKNLHESLIKTCLGNDHILYSDMGVVVQDTCVRRKKT